MRIPPKVDANIDKEETLAALDEEPKTIIKGDPKFDALLAEYLFAKGEADAQTKRVNSLSKELMGMYLDGHRSDTFRMSVSKCSRASFDATKFAEDYPELYQQYVKSLEYTRTTVKRK
jgi:hypothetical protein